MVLDTMKYRGRIKAWHKKYDALAPKVGDIAPDFELYNVNGEKPVRLSSFQGQKPVVLIFGNYTWPPFVRGTVGLHDLYLKHHDRMQFLMIYTREAHPMDGWWLGGGITGHLATAIVKGGIAGQLTKAMGVGGSTEQLPDAVTDVNDPKTIEERRAVAGRCAIELKYEMPTYVDTMDDEVSKAYAGFPTRLYIIGLDGRVGYDCGLGPFGFRNADFGAVIEKYLAQKE